MSEREQPEPDRRFGEREQHRPGELGGRSNPSVSSDEPLVVNASRQPSWSSPKNATVKPPKISDQRDRRAARAARPARTAP